MKKLMTSCCVLALMLASQNAALAAFNDVNEVSEYAEAIFWMQEHEVVKGYADSTFGGDLCVNRAEFLKMLFEVLDLEPPKPRVIPFYDVKADQWFTPYVAMAKQRGLINGYSDGTFKPYQCVNRAEAVKISVLEFNDGAVPQASGWGISNYDDVAPNDWYSEQMNYAFSSNLVGTNHAGKKYYPGNHMTRKEVAEMLFRMKTIRDHKLAYYYEGYEPSYDDDELFYQAEECKLDDYTSKADINSVVEKDSSVVITADHTNTGQLTKLRNLFGKFDRLEFMQIAIDEYNNSIEDALGYSSSMQAVLEADWKFVLSAVIPEDYVNNYAVDPSVIVAAKIEKAEDFEKFAGRMMANDTGNQAQCEAGDDYVFWTNADYEMYIVRYGDIFVLTNTAESRDAVLARMRANENFSVGNNFKTYSAVKEDKLFSAYLNFKDIYPLLAQELYYYEEPTTPSYLSLLAEVYVALIVEDDGFRMPSLASFQSSSNSFLDAYKNYQIQLANKIPGDSTIFYVEQPFLLNETSSIVSESMTGVGTTEDLVAELATEIGVTNEEITAALNSPFAISVANTGGVIPAFSFYVQLNDSTAPVGEAAAKAMDISLEEELSSDPVLSDAVTKTTLYDGALRKVVIDLSKLPADETSEFEAIFGTGAGSEAMSIYYGVMSDNVFVVSTLSNFENAYGKNALASQAKYKTALASLDVYGSAVSYADITELLVLLDNYFQNEVFSYYYGYDDYGYVKNDGMTEEDQQLYDSVMEFLNRFKYVVSAARIDGDVLVQDAFVKID